MSISATNKDNSILSSKLLLSTVNNNNRLLSNYEDEDDDEEEEEDDNDDEEDLMLSMKKFHHEKTTSSSSSSSSSSFTSGASLSPKNNESLPVPLPPPPPNNYIRYSYFDASHRQQDLSKSNASLLVDIEYLSYNDTNNNNNNQSDLIQANSSLDSCDQRLSIDSSASNSSSTSTTTTSSSSSSALPSISMPISKNTSADHLLLNSNQFLPIVINQTEEDDDLLLDAALIQQSNAIMSRNLKENDGYEMNTQRIEHLFTPDSLESVSSNCNSSTASLTDDLIDENNNKNEKSSSSSSLDNIKMNEKLAENEAKLEEKHKLDEDLVEDDDQEISSINSTSDTSLILEKIRKINKLQEKINDINNKIKSIDMTADNSTEETNTTSLNQFNEDESTLKNNDFSILQAESDPSEGVRYYINPNYCEDDEEDNSESNTTSKSQQITENNSNFFQSNQPFYCANYDDEDEEEEEDEDDDKLNYLKNQLLKSANLTQANYRSLNNQTRLGIRRGVAPDDDDDEYEDENEDYNETNEYDDEDEDEDDDDDDIGTYYKHAQPVASLGKKYASTGLLFHRFGGYLAPIEENDAEYALSSGSSSSSLSDSSSLMNELQPAVANRVSIKGSTSCFNLSNSLNNNNFKSKMLIESSINAVNNSNKQEEEEEDRLVSSSPPVITNSDNQRTKSEYDNCLSISNDELNKHEQEVKYNDENKSNVVEDDHVPEDNVERLRNIRDMFENSNATNDSDEVILQRVEKPQPSQKLLERLSNETNINLHEFDFEQMLMMPPPPLPLTESNNTNDSGSSTTSSTHNEDEDELNTTSSHNETDEYFVKKNLQINLVNAQCMLDTKMDILQEERSINGDFLAAPHHNDDQNDTASNQSSDAQMSPTPNNLGINSSKTTSSVSSSTSISSSHAESVEETTTPLPVLDCNPNEPHPQVHANLEQESLINFEPATTNNNSISIETNDRFLEATAEPHEEEHVNPGDLQQSTSYRYKQKDIITIGDIRSVDMRSARTRFERFREDSDEDDEDNYKPKPIRAITPPPEGVNVGEIENQPKQRDSNVVSAYDKVDTIVPKTGSIRSKKELFTTTDANGNKQAKPKGIKEITPPREDILKRVLKETTPERNENVVHASDKFQDVLPSRGNAKQKAAVFLNSESSRGKAIERSGIKLEGELTEKGLAKQRAAIFSDPSTYVHSTMSTTEIEAEYFKQNVSGVAKERLNIFKNLEQQQLNPSRTSPSREVRKLKEFTPPPQLDPHLQQQRQYIIVDKDMSEFQSSLLKEYNKDEFFVESGLAKNRIKQYLNQDSSQSQVHIDHGTGELSEKRLAKSLLAKWKSMENSMDKETSPEPGVQVGRLRDRFNPEDFNRNRSPSEDAGEEKENLIQAGYARSLLKQWQNIDASQGETRARRAPRQITPPPEEELRRQSMNDQDAAEAVARKARQAQLREEEMGGLIGRGHAKNTLARLEQSLQESNTKVRRTVTPPKEFINKVLNSEQNYVYESTPVESGINSQFAEHEDVIPGPGHAKTLKNRFINLEKEASKVETSASKMNYVPKKFTSSSPAAVTAAQAEQTTNTQPKKQTNGAPKKITADKIAAVTTPSTQHVNPNKELNTNIYLNHHQSTLSADKCCVCEKTVYAMEKIEADKKIYHKLCFKCTSCNCTLNEDGYDFADNKPYCAVHIKQFLSPTKAAKKAVVYDTVNNVIQVREMEELKIDTSFKQPSTPGVRSPASQPMSPNSQPMSPSNKQNSPAVKQSSQPQSPAMKQQSQPQSPVAAKPQPQLASPGGAKTPLQMSPTKHVSQAQFSPR